MEEMDARGPTHQLSGRHTVSSQAPPMVASQHRDLDPTRPTTNPAQTHNNIAFPPRPSQLQAFPPAQRPPLAPTQPDLFTFGSTAIRHSQKSFSSRAQLGPVNDYDRLFKPGTPGAFPRYNNSRPPQPHTHVAAVPSAFNKPVFKYHASTSAASSGPGPAKDEQTDREEFDLKGIKIGAADLERYHGDAEKHMRELLAGAVGDADEAVGDGEDIVDGFAENIRLMPHQVRGVRWMRERESGRKYGGILADDMGLGKTVQTLARIVEGKRTAAEAKAGYRGGTLIICPLAVLEQWKSEAATKTKPGLLKVGTHHGPSRTKSGGVLEKLDIVITTFQTLVSEHGAFVNANPSNKAIDDDELSDDSFGTSRAVLKSKKAAAHALFDVKWLRIVVDEAQNIKNRKTKATKAAVALSAKYRWCLTGTPIQNNVEELYSLFWFLRARPLDNFAVFSEQVSRHVKDGRVNMAMKRLHLILKAIMLRRTKDATIDGKAILNLPGRDVRVVSCEFDASEREFYDTLEARIQKSLERTMREGKGNKALGILVLLLRLRQACDHPQLVTASLDEDPDAFDTEGVEAAEESSGAVDDIADLLGKLEVAAVPTRPLVESCSDDPPVHAGSKTRKVGDQSRLPASSAKIRQLLRILDDVAIRNNGDEKTLIFSQFTKFIDIIEPFLKHRSMRFVRYDGAMKNERRQEALDVIKNDPKVKIILMSFKAGSTGLNLTCCNHVVLCDVWWNPALEDQAFDRAHRLGQTRDVFIHKLTVPATVEDRILDLQDNKRALASAALSGGKISGKMKLTLDDMLKLFRGGVHGDAALSDNDEEEE